MGRKKEMTEEDHGTRLEREKYFGVSEVSRKNKKGGVIIPDDNIT